MILGHVATALVARRAAPKMPWWLLIASATLIDVIMFALVGLGIETMERAPGAVGPTLSSQIVEMTYSHDLVPQLFWAFLLGGAVLLFTRNYGFSLIAAGLCVFHWLCDLVAGYEHFVFGPETAALGTDWYRTNLPAALTVEALLGVACVFLFTYKRQAAPRVTVPLYGLFGLLPFAFLVI